MVPAGWSGRGLDARGGEEKLFFGGALTSWHPILAAPSHSPCFAPPPPSSPRAALHCFLFSFRGFRSLQDTHNELATLNQSQETFVIHYQELCRIEQQQKQPSEQLTPAAAQELQARRQQVEGQLAAHATSLVQAREVLPSFHTHTPRPPEEKGRIRRRRRKEKKGGGERRKEEEEDMKKERNQQKKSKQTTFSFLFLLVFSSLGPSRHYTGSSRPRCSRSRSFRRACWTCTCAAGSWHRSCPWTPPSSATNSHPSRHGPVSKREREKRKNKVLRVLWLSFLVLRLACRASPGHYPGKQASGQAARHAANTAPPEPARR